MSGYPSGMAGWSLPGRYTPSALVATGGMGDVYRATDRMLGRTVAVKVLAERHARDPEIRARFTREAHTAAQLSTHPHVVIVFDVGEREGRPFIVMEYLHGGTVHDRLREDDVPVSTALEWLRQTASALDAAHARGVVHRDVKPANLMLDEHGRVHVTDFGIASAAGSDTLTLPGTVLGTAGYLAPEQAGGEQASPASDRYALGVVAFELLTGRRPFASDTPVTEAFAHLNAPVPSARVLAPGLPAGVDGVLERALSKDPRGRPESALDLVEELRSAFREVESETLVLPAPVSVAHPSPTGVSVASKRRGTRRWLAGIASGAVLLVAGAATAGLLDDGGEGPRERTVTRVRTQVTTVSDSASTFTITETTTVPTTTDAADEPLPDDPGDGASLNDDGFALMQEGDYVNALPLLERAVSALAGSSSLAEAYASYNLAFTRFALGRCDGVLELLDRSQVVQGKRSEIDRLRREAEKQCGDSTGRGKGKGKNEDEG